MRTGGRSAAPRVSTGQRTGIATLGRREECDAFARFRLCGNDPATGDVDRGGAPVRRGGCGALALDTDSEDRQSRWAAAASSSRPVAALASRSPPVSARPESPSSDTGAPRKRARCAAPPRCLRWSPPRPNDHCTGHSAVAALRNPPPPAGALHCCVTLCQCWSCSPAYLGSTSATAAPPCGPGSIAYTTACARSAAPSSSRGRPCTSTSTVGTPSAARRVESSRCPSCIRKSWMSPGFSVYASSPRHSTTTSARPALTAVAVTIASVASHVLVAAWPSGEWMTHLNIMGLGLGLGLGLGG
eukprot:scaffold52492_cov57-Phaeocystis_antarctica.AAC.2